MKINIKAEYTGQKDYFNWNDNLLIKALEDKGITDVYLQVGEWNGKKKKLWGLYTTQVEGRITPKANGIIKKLSNMKFDSDTIVDLEEE